MSGHWTGHLQLQVTPPRANFVAPPIPLGGTRSDLDNSQLDPFANMLLVYSHPRYMVPTSKGLIHDAPTSGIVASLDFLVWQIFAWSIGYGRTKGRDPMAHVLYRADICNSGRIL